MVARNHRMVESVDFTEAVVFTVSATVYIIYNHILMINID